MIRSRIMQMGLACLMFVSAHAAALRLDLVPGSPSVNVGGSVQLSLVMSGLTALNQIVSSWSLGLAFDSGIVASSGFAFGPALGTGLDVIEGSQSAAGGLSLFSVSLLGDGALEALQGDSVTLGVVTFLGVAPGIASIAFADGDFGLAFTGIASGATLTELLPDLGGARIEVLPPNRVPLPPTLALLALAFVAVLPFRRRA